MLPPHAPAAHRPQARRRSPPACAPPRPPHSPRPARLRGPAIRVARTGRQRSLSAAATRPSRACRRKFSRGAARTPRRRRRAPPARPKGVRSASHQQTRSSSSRQRASRGVRGRGGAGRGSGGEVRGPGRRRFCIIPPHHHHHQTSRVQVAWMNCGDTRAGSRRRSPGRAKAWARGRRYQ